MLAHLKKIWKLTLCNGLFIHLIGCNQISMHMDAHSDSGEVPMQSDQVPTGSTMLTNHKLGYVNGSNSVLAKYTIHQGLYNFYEAFFKKIGAFYWEKSNTNTAPQLLIKDINLALGLLGTLNTSKPLISKDAQNKIKFFIYKSDKMLNASTNTIGDFFYWDHTYTTAMKALNTLNQFNLNNGTMHVCTRACCQSADQHAPATMEPLKSLLANEKDNKNKGNITAKSK